MEYLFFLKDLQANTFLAEFWESAFLKFPPRSARDLRAYPAVGFGIFEALFQNIAVDVDLSNRMGVFLAASWMIGVVTLYRQGRRDLLALLVAPAGVRGGGVDAAQVPAQGAAGPVHRLGDLAGGRGGNLELDGREGRPPTARSAASCSAVPCSCRPSRGPSS